MDPGQDVSPAATTAGSGSDTPVTGPTANAVADLRAKLATVSGQFAWDGNRLAITDAATLDRLTNRVMSASTMNALDGCPSRWAFEKVWPGDADPFSPAEVGSGAHAVLERLYELPPLDRTTANAMIILREVAQLKLPGAAPLDVAVRDRWLAEVYTAFKGIFTIEDPTLVNVEGRELQVDATIAGITFTGYVDRLDRNGDDGLTVVDYKSSAKLPKSIRQFGDPHGDQQRLYLLALEQIRGELPDAAYLHYIRLGQTKKVAQSKARLVETRDRFVVAAESLKLMGEKGSLPTAHSPLCGWCPLVNACPVAAREGKVDRTDHAVPGAWLPIPTIGAPTRTTGPWPSYLPAVDPDDDEPPTTPQPVAIEAPVAAEVVSTAHEADHITDSDIDKQGDTMTRLKEGQAYVELADGDLNPSSYAAMAVVDVTEMAVFTLDKAGVQLTRTGVEALAGMYASVILDVQRNVTGASSWHDGMNSRARFLVKRVLRTLPTPVHADAETWQGWAGAVVKRATLMWNVGYGLWSEGAPETHTAAAHAVSEAVAAAKTRAARTTTQTSEDHPAAEPEDTESPASADTDPVPPAGTPSVVPTVDADDDGSGFGDFNL